MNYKTTIPTILFIVAIVQLLFANSSYITPMSDYRENISPVSIRGIISNKSDSILTIQCENRKNIIEFKKKLKLIDTTSIFTEYGGVVDLNELLPGQYVWIWYVSQDIKVAGNPPKAAAIILWSKDPKDQPNDKDKRHYDKK